MWQQRVFSNNNILTRPLYFGQKYGAGLHQYCTTAKSSSDAEAKPKTITEVFTESMKLVTEQRLLRGKSTTKKSTVKREMKYKEGGIKPANGYIPRFKYNGYLQRVQWVRYTEEDREKKEAGPTEEQETYRRRDKARFCILLGFAGGKYSGMQYGRPTTDTIERRLFKAFAKADWILQEHISAMFRLEYGRVSRTDRGVSAARMFCAANFPTDVSIEELNEHFPSDIRVFGMKRVTPSFNPRLDCSARTYSYTLPSIAFSEFNETAPITNYRVPMERLQLANDVLSIFKGRRNFHNYTLGKYYFDVSASRRIISVNVSEPFIVDDVEFCRIIIKGESFMMHQIRKMIGTSLGVIRGLITQDFVSDTFTDVKHYLPKAPGLGLMLENLHFDQYAKKFPTHDPLTFEECDEQIEQFRSDIIHPVIIDTEKRENSMLNWLDLLSTHTFDGKRQELDDTNCEAPNIEGG